MDVPQYAYYAPSNTKEGHLCLGHMGAAFRPLMELIESRVSPALGYSGRPPLRTAIVHISGKPFRQQRYRPNELVIEATREYSKHSLGEQFVPGTATAR